MGDLWRGHTNGDTEYQGRLAAIVESSTDAILSKTVEGIITSWNPAAERLYGYRPDEVIGRHVSLLVPHDKRAELVEILACVASGTPVQRLETVRVAKDGMRFHVLLSAAPLLDPAGGVVGASVTTHDITERVRNHQDLQRLAAIVESSSDAILSKTVEGIITSWNPAAERLYGYRADEVIGQHISILVPPDLQVELGEILEKVAAGSAVERLETVRVHRDGTELRVLLTVRPLFDRQGLVVGASTVARDITEQALAAQAREEAELRFRASFRRSAFGMAITDLDGTPTAVNPALCEMLGRRPEELIGHGWEQFGHPSDATTPVTRLGGLGEDTDSYSYDRRYFRPDASMIWLHNNVTLIRDDHDRPTFLMAQLQDVTDRKRFEAEMQHRALHDDLTGLPNRALLDDRIERALSGRHRARAPVGVAFLDLDDFKNVNDALGHSVGDRLLVEVAHRLAATVRPADTVARFGGDEFVLVCQEITPDALLSLADRVIESIRGPFFIQERTVSLRASLGLTISRNQSTAQSLISEADAAMYRAKERGRGQYAMFDDSLRQHATTRLEGEQQLRSALAHGDILAYYQPIVELSSGAIAGVEALARWRTGDGRLATPYEFIPLAEACGLIGDLDEQILDQGIDTIATWNTEPLITSHQWVSVNLSALQLADRHLVDLVADALLRCGIHPWQLHFEITETVAMRDVGQSIGILEDLKSLGVNLSIDDFGTGYSSLAYLQQLPLDTLKIDRSFVNRIDQPTSDGSVSIVAAILSLAEALNLTCVAEGVETAAQRDVLMDLGCTHAQGYLWSEPLPGAEAFTWALAHQERSPT